MYRSSWRLMGIGSVLGGRRYFTAWNNKGRSTVSNAAVKSTNPQYKICPPLFVIWLSLFRDRMLS